MSQKAVQAHKYALIADVTLTLAAKKFKTTVRQVNDANGIAGLGRQDILQSIMNTGEWMSPTGTKSKSLRTIFTNLKLESEELLEVEDNYTKIDYEDLVNTQKGKLEFWNMKTLIELSLHERNMLIVQLLNYKYVLKVDKETGEITEDYIKEKDK